VKDISLEEFTWTKNIMIGFGQTLSENSGTFFPGTKFFLIFISEPKNIYQDQGIFSREVHKKII
jgi:hypothetical protein